MRAVLVLAVIAMTTCGCEADGRACHVSSECGDGYICRYPFPAGHPLLCGTLGLCTRYVTCGFGTPCQPAPGVCAIDVEGGTSFACTCDGLARLTSSTCPSEPLLEHGYYGISGRGACTCEDLVLSQPVHFGPRGSTEYCRSGHGWAPPRCCDCTNGIAGFAQWGGCPSGIDPRGDMPLGCCNCFTAAAPDPTGACAPPGGYTRPWPWCCPIGAPPPDASVAPDAQ